MEPAQGERVGTLCPHRRALESGQPLSGEWHDACSGRTYMASFYPLPGGSEVAGNVHLLRGITEHKRAGEALPQRNRNLALLSEIAAASGQTLDLARRPGAIAQFYQQPSSRRDCPAG